MVMSTTHLEGRAGSLHLIGGALALDFANTASGRGSDASNSVNQTDPRGGCPGRWWIVCRIQTPSGSSGDTARR